MVPETCYTPSSGSAIGSDPSKAVRSIVVETVQVMGAGVPGLLDADCRLQIAGWAAVVRFWLTCASSRNNNAQVL